jgi:hypothetical protein
MRLAPALLLLLLLVQCSVGTKVKNYQPAQGPAGAAVTLELSGQRSLTGELLTVEDSTLLLQAGGQLHRVRLSRVATGKAPKLTFRGSAIRPEQRERLRLISRYPQGVSPELLSRLLRAYGQTEVQETS